MRRLRFAVPLAALLASLSCGSSSDTAAPTPPAVASVVITPAAASLDVGGTTQFSASVRDASGAVLSGQSVTWSSSDQSKVTISASGLATGVAAGTATITATSGGRSGTAAITVLAPSRDFSIAGAEWTQGVQDASASIPMVLDGDAAVVNVLVQSSTSFTAPMQLVLRLFNASGALVRADTALTTSTINSSVNYISPTAQFLVPASAIQAGLRWQVVRDPKGLIKDDSAANDVFPRTGTAALATAAVPTLNLRFVPIVIAANNNSTPVVNESDFTEYLRVLKATEPIGKITPHIGNSFTTSASFGTAPTGGDASFWTAMISELDLARLADPTEPTANWHGLVAPPSGFTFTNYGGYSYIPALGTSSARFTRTSSSVRLGWFSRQSQARELIAHELGHTFGRAHAPCGSAGAPLDANYPVQGGVLDTYGHDVYSWATGAASSAVTINASTTGDLMGYCTPVWASTYTYKAMLAFRQPAVLASAAPSERQHVVIVRGTVNAGRIELAPSFALTAFPSLPDGGSYHLEGRAADGRVLFAISFEPNALDHSPDVRQFAYAVPLSETDEAALDEIRVTGPEGEAVRQASRVTPQLPVGARAALVRRNGLAVNAACDASYTRGVLILDAQTGVALGAASAASAAANASPGRALTVLCSDGVRTSAAHAVAP